jgi:plastocyanin
VGAATTAVATTGEATTSGHGRPARTLPSRLATAAVVVLVVTAAAGPATVEVRVRMSRRGIEPAEVTLRRGETVRMVVSSGDGAEHCFAVEELRVEKRVVPARDTRFELTPERAGVFRIDCCLAADGQDHPEHAELRVLE